MLVRRVVGRKSIVPRPKFSRCPMGAWRGLSGGQNLFERSLDYGRRACRFGGSDHACTYWRFCVTEPSTRLLDIERRSIEFIPENERHGRVVDQGPFWFLSNFHFFAIAIGFVGPSLGLTLGYSALAGTLGILLGTTFQAFHASQGAELGLPQMIQSRAQFGGRGVIVPLLGVLVSLLGYNVVSTVLIAEGLHELWGANGAMSAVGVSALA